MPVGARQASCFDILLPRGYVYFGAFFVKLSPGISRDKERRIGRKAPQYWLMILRFAYSSLHCTRSY